MPCIFARYFKNGNSKRAKREKKGDKMPKLNETSLGQTMARQTYIYPMYMCEHLQGSYETGASSLHISLYLELFRTFLAFSDFYELHEGVWLYMCVCECGRVCVCVGDCVCAPATDMVCIAYTSRCQLKFCIPLSLSIRNRLAQSCRKWRLKMAQTADQVS